MGINTEPHIPARIVLENAGTAWNFKCRAQSYAELWYLHSVMDLVIYYISSDINIQLA